MCPECGKGSRWSDQFTKFIRDVGFPVAVCAYLLLGLGPKVDGMKAAIDRLTFVLESRGGK